MRRADDLLDEQVEVRVVHGKRGKEQHTPANVELLLPPPAEPGGLPSHARRRAAVQLHIVGSRCSAVRNAKVARFSGCIARVRAIEGVSLRFASLASGARFQRATVFFAGPDGKSIVPAHARARIASSLAADLDAPTS